MPAKRHSTRKMLKSPFRFIYDSFPLRRIVFSRSRYVCRAPVGAAPRFPLQRAAFFGRFFCKLLSKYPKMGYFIIAKKQSLVNRKSISQKKSRKLFVRGSAGYAALCFCTDAVAFREKTCAEQLCSFWIFSAPLLWAAPFRGLLYALKRADTIWQAVFPLASLTAARRDPESGAPFFQCPGTGR